MNDNRTIQEPLARNILWKMLTSICRVICKTSLEICVDIQRAVDQKIMRIDNRLFFFALVSASFADDVLCLALRSPRTL